MKALIALCVLLCLMSCSNTPSHDKEDMETICLDGVVYYYFYLGSMQHETGYMSVKFNRDSKVVRCD